MRFSCWLCEALAGLVVSTFAPTALADTATRVGVWRAPEACPQEAAFTAQIEKFLGQPLGAQRDQSLVIECEVESSAGEYVAKLRVQTERGTQQRDLSHQDCAGLIEAAALVTALAIDPTLTLREGSTETPATAPAPQPTAPEPPPSPKPVAAVSSAPRPERSNSSPHWSAAALGLVGSSVLPDVGFGFGARAQLGTARFSALVQGEYWLPRFLPIEGAAAPGLDFGAWGVGLAACGSPLVGRLSLALCVGPKLGDMYGAGNADLTNPRTVHRRWSSLNGEVHARYVLVPGLATWLGVEVGKVLEQPRFGISIDGSEVEVYAVGEWIINGFIGLGASF